jgi:hypothetical protein
MEPITDIATYLRAHAQELGDRILESYPPLHAIDDPPSPLISKLLRNPYPAQTIAIMGLVRRWQQARAGAVIAECGTVFAALFRQLPGQKRSLYDFATHAQPEIDLTFSVNRARYRSLLKVDPKSRQMESYLFNSEGAPLKALQQRGQKTFLARPRNA